MPTMRTLAKVLGLALLLGGLAASVWVLTDTLVEPWQNGTRAQVWLNGRPIVETPDWNAPRDARGQLLDVRDDRELFPLGPRRRTTPRRDLLAWSVAAMAAGGIALLSLPRRVAAA